MTKADLFIFFAQRVSSTKQRCFQAMVTIFLNPVGPSAGVGTPRGGGVCLRPFLAGTTAARLTPDKRFATVIVLIAVLPASDEIISFQIFAVTYPI